MTKSDRIEHYRELQRLEYQHAKRDLGFFTQVAWDVLEPETELKWNWHHDLICEYLTAAYMGQIRRLIINVCPRSTKTILTSVSFPSWAWQLDPALRFLFGSYAEDLSTKNSVLRRNLIESSWYQRGFGHRFKMAPDVNMKSQFANNKTGHMKSYGIKSPPTGEGGDYLIIDDPHNPKGAESEKERLSTLQDFDLGWTSRLNDKKTGRIIVIMQRLHEQDMTGHLLEKNLGYVHVKIPSIAEERERIVFPISKRVIEREAGDLMHPARDGVPELEQAKADMGPYGFAGQHQQSPTPASGGTFTKAMFDFVEPPEDPDYRFIMADTAYDDKKQNDFTVFTAFAVKKGELYIEDVYRKQIKSSEVEQDVTPFITRFSKWGFRGCYIEPKGHGIYLNQALPKQGIMIPDEDKRKEFFKDRRLDKTERANNAVPYLANRRVHINPMIANKEILLAEVLTFPKAKHDDFTDTVIDGVKFTFARKIGILDVL